MEAKDTLWHIDWGDGDTFYVIAPDKETAIGAMPDGKDMVNYVVRLDSIATEIFKAGKEEANFEWRDKKVPKIMKQFKQAGIRGAIKVYEPYVKLLGEEIDGLFGLAFAHGWRSKRVKAGKKCREEIAKLKEWGIKEDK